MILKFQIKTISFSWGYGVYPCIPIYFMYDEVRWIPTEKSEAIKMADFYQKFIPRKL